MLHCLLVCEFLMLSELSSQSAILFKVSYLDQLHNVHVCKNVVPHEDKGFQTLLSLIVNAVADLHL